MYSPVRTTANTVCSTYTCFLLNTVIFLPVFELFEMSNSVTPSLCTTQQFFYSACQKTNFLMLGKWQEDIAYLSRSALDCRYNPSGSLRSNV
jgi:hypothetical protein